MRRVTLLAGLGLWWLAAAQVPGLVGPVDVGRGLGGRALAWIQESDDAGIDPPAGPGLGPAPSTPAPVAASVPYAELFNAAGERYGIDPMLLAAIGFCESSYDPGASSGLADGLMQFRPSTAVEYGVDVWDPASSVDGAARYLLDSIDHLDTTDPAILAASYNAGRYGSAVEAHRIPQNGETPGYVTCVEGRL